MFKQWRLDRLNRKYCILRAKQHRIFSYTREGRIKIIEYRIKALEK